MSDSGSNHKGNLLVFDIETEPFNDDFYQAQKNQRSLFTHMPRPRVCCVFDSVTDEYSRFDSGDFMALASRLSVLKGSYHVLGFNSAVFDENVIKKCLGIKESESLIPPDKHLDLLRLINDATGKSFKLDQLVRENLDERKHTDGREMANMDIDSLYEACKSDVRQTYLLYRLFEKDELRYPQRKKAFSDQCDGYTGIQGYKYFNPEFVENMTEDQEMEITSGMTDGQLADWMAGWR